jgi:hypothetical protein
LQLVDQNLGGGAHVVFGAHKRLLRVVGVYMAYQ